MKFIHISDIHIGMKPDVGCRWSDKRADEIINTLDRVIDECNEKNVELLLIAGDLFHKQPLLKDLKEVNYMFSKLKETHVVLIAGNHDYISVTSKYKDFEWNDNVHMLMDSKIESVYIRGMNVEVYGFSYDERNICEHRYETITPDDEHKINILLAHGGDSKDVPIDFSQMKESKFDYIALGHIHKPEIIHNNMAYSGSLEPLDKTELGEHGYIYGEIVDKKCSIQFVPFSTRKYVKKRMLVDASVTNAKLIDKVKEVVSENGKDNMYLLSIEGYKDPDIVFDFSSLKREYNIISIEDSSLPDIDFDKLYKENKDNILGMFIEKIQLMKVDDEIKTRSLYLGIEALKKKV